MRIVTSINVLAACGAWLLLAHTHDVRGYMPFARGASEADAAVEVRCGDLPSSRRRTCDDELTQRFASGHATPGTVLRMHCTLSRSVWNARLPAPPALCQARFGGWLTS